MIINAGSGQRKFPAPWVNLDFNPKWEPDVVGDMTYLPFSDETAELIVSHHTVEHLWQAHAQMFFQESYRVLKPGGGLMVFVPNPRALSKMWLLGGIDEFTFMVNTYGAYMGNAVDLHRWGYTADSLREMLLGVAKWRDVRVMSDGGPSVVKVEGVELPMDWWVLSMEAIK